MADKIFSIADGLHDELPPITTAKAGRILITTDKGEMYYEPEDKKRVKINNADQTYTPDSENAQSGKAVAEALEPVKTDVSDLQENKVDDVQINSLSIVENGIANIPIADDNKVNSLGVLGVYRGRDGLFIPSNQKGTICIKKASKDGIDNRLQGRYIWQGGYDYNVPKSYHITTPEQLYNLIFYSTESGTFYLDNDIYLNDVSDPNWMNKNPREWKSPSSNLNVSTFLGSIDGCGHTIYGLYVNNNTTESTKGGLIPYYHVFDRNVTIKNIGIKNAYIKAYNAGALVGDMGGGDDSSPTITISNCFADESVIVAGTNSAGLVAAVYTTPCKFDMNNCYSRVIFDSDYYPTNGRNGSLIGQFLNDATRTINNCYVILRHEDYNKQISILPRADNAEELNYAYSNVYGANDTNNGKVQWGYNSYVFNNRWNSDFRSMNPISKLSNFDWANTWIAQPDNGYAELRVFVENITSYDCLPIVSTNLDYAIKSAICDGKGAAWTADEQKAARKRIGVNELELIEKIIVGYSVTTSKPSDWNTNYKSYYTNTGTTKEPIYSKITSTSTPTWKSGKYYKYSDSVGLLSRSVEPDGISYNFRKIVMEIDNPSTSHTSSALLINNSSDMILTTISIANTSYKQYTYICIDLTEGQGIKTTIISSMGGFTNTSTTDQRAIRNTNNVTNINSISFERAIPSGTIYIYGVRA